MRMIDHRDQPDNDHEIKNGRRIDVRVVLFMRSYVGTVCTIRSLRVLYLVTKHASPVTEWGCSACVGSAVSVQRR